MTQTANIRPARTAAEIAEVLTQLPLADQTPAAQTLNAFIEGMRQGLTMKQKDREEDSVK